MRPTTTSLTLDQSSGHTGLFLALGLLAIGALTMQGRATELKGTPDELRQFLHPQEKQVTLRTQVEETAYADKAIVNLLVTTEEDKLSESLQKNDQLKLAIRKALSEAGVDAKSINTSKFSSTPQYGWFGSEPDSYEIVARLAIEIDKTEQFNAIAALVDKYKEVRMGAVSYKHTDKDEVKARLRKKAMQKLASAKADYETELGVKLKAQTFSDSEIGFSPTPGAAEKLKITGSRVRRESKRSDSYSDAPMSGPAISQPQSFDEVKYELSVWVQYEVVQ